MTDAERKEPSVWVVERLWLGDFVPIDTTSHFERESAERLLTYYGGDGLRVSEYRRLPTKRAKGK